MKDVTIAAISLRSRPVSPDENIARHEEWVKKAREKGAEYCFFPEMSVTGFCFNYPLYFAASEPEYGESTLKMIEIAKKYDAVIGFGLATRDKRDLVYNSYIFVSPSGYLGKYSKTHIPTLEYPIETAANDFAVVDLGGVRAGVNICFDNWFCESGRASYLNGAQIILAPFYMSWGDATIKTNPLKAFADWKKLAMINFPAVAWQNGVYHITINSCGGVNERGVEYDGPSVVFIFNPQGELEAESDPNITDEQMVVHKIEAEKVHRRRSEELFHPKYRRPEIYQALTQLYR
jgi:predicted amidohydrolase